MNQLKLSAGHRRLAALRVMQIPSSRLTLLRGRRSRRGQRRVTRSQTKTAAKMPALQNEGPEANPPGLSVSASREAQVPDGNVGFRTIYALLAPQA